MDMGYVLEERYTTIRDAIFRILSMSPDYSVEVANAFIEVFAPLMDDGEHGAVLWALMVKTQGIKTGVLGMHFKVYMQYYYMYRVSASQRQGARRTLDVSALSFLVCCAAFGYTRGVQEYDRAWWGQDAAAVDNTIVDKAAFLSFFNATDDQFSFLHMWRLVDRLWDAWDCNSPILIHGFVTPAISEHLLGLRKNNPGSFLLRFSSRGGLAVDFLRPDGKLEKAHWKYGTLVDCIALRSLLWESQWTPNLQFLVDTTYDNGFNANVLKKGDVFPEGSTYAEDHSMDSDTPVVVSSSYRMAT